MKQLFLSIQNKLAELTELKHIDKNWGQLQYEQPPVKFPCALLDIANVKFSQMGRWAQQAEGDIEITVANLYLSNTSTANPDAYRIFDLMDSINDLLHGNSFAGSSRLLRTNIQKEMHIHDKVPYAAVHNEELQAGRGRGFTMPKRQFMGDSKELTDNVTKKIKNEE